MDSSSEKTVKCYICGRTKKDFISHFNPNAYDKEISDAESSISQDLKEISVDIKSILAKSENYDAKLTIGELEDNQKLTSKLMPDWQLLMKRLSPTHYSSGNWGRRDEDKVYFDSNWRTCTIEDIRKELREATVALDSGHHPKEKYTIPESIRKKEEALETIKLKREALQDLIANPGFNNYETVLREVKDSKEKISMRFSLCPICANLHKEYHSSISQDDGGWDDW